MNFRRRRRQARETPQEELSVVDMTTHSSLYRAIEPLLLNPEDRGERLRVNEAAKTTGYVELYRDSRDGRTKPYVKHERVDEFRERLSRLLDGSGILHRPLTAKPQQQRQKTPKKKPKHKRREIRIGVGKYLGRYYYKIPQGYVSIEEIIDDYSNRRAYRHDVLVRTIILSHKLLSSDYRGALQPINLSRNLVPYCIIPLNKRGRFIETFSESLSV